MTRLRIALLALAAGMVGAGYVSADSRSAMDELGVGWGNDGVKVSAPVVSGPAAAGRAAGEAAREASLLAGPAVKDLTVMFYMNGRNNLGIHHFRDLYKMEQAGSTASMNVVAEKGSLGGKNMFDQTWAGSRRYFVRKSPEEFPDRFYSTVLAEFPTVDMGDWRHALEFVRWAKTGFPARRYVLVISDHGSGLFDVPRRPATAGGSAKGISFDEKTGNSISNLALAAILREAGGVDVLVLDACLMQAAEIGYELRGLTPYVVGSEEVSWTNTMDQQAVLKALAAAPAAAPLALARTVVRASVPGWRGKEHQKLSVVSTAEFDAFTTLLDVWADDAVRLADTRAAKAARDRALRFEDPWAASRNPLSCYADLYDFVKLYGENLDLARPGAAQLKALGDAVLEHLRTRLVAQNATKGFNRAGRSMADARGLSIYVPPAQGLRVNPDPGGEPVILAETLPSQQAAIEGQFANRYDDYAFARNTRWRAFVNYLWSLPPER